MAIIIDDKYKTLYVKTLGPNKLFAAFDLDDQAKRKQLSDADAIALFNRAWSHHGLEQYLVNAEVIEPDKALERLSSAYKEHFRRDQEHREFRHQRLNLEFIAQLKSADKGHQLTQLWPIKSTDYDPRMLPVWFDDADQKKQFDALAGLLQKRNGSDLAKEILLDFMRKFPLQMIEDALRQLSMREGN